MESTWAAADGVCILELQDRSLGMLMLMLGESILLSLVMMLWFLFRLSHLFFTSIFPVLRSCRLGMLWSDVCALAVLRKLWGLRNVL
jgi:hypothetical protein